MGKSTSEVSIKKNGDRVSNCIFLSSAMLVLFTNILDIPLMCLHGEMKTTNLLSSCYFERFVVFLSLNDVKILMGATAFALN